MMSFFIFQTFSLLAAMSTAFLAGIFFIFHNTVMVVLAEQSGMNIMKRINQIIINKAFLLIFMLSPLSSLFVLIIGYSNKELTLQSPLVMGAMLAIVSFFITIRFNVPLNNRLEQEGENKGLMWQEYLVLWGHWNTRRFYLSAIACVAMYAEFIFGLCV
ncbi:DUF1772 domain-containing protein [Enterovibrio sp. ZSDZ35]|uniref:DUF1772 domain-containing protein n=1 Tax=Enterovibrio qingdaonensis TaxID=2899818 RepID=A0ABT5QQN7_9GAMM|nr:anthrone oxygenase family protein [Enterovibrio sp. ZSDZ35]MDD1783184.1 DUF1772 domain-containing protein [Enterovibrio sp. ZSDZ35]